MKERSRLSGTRSKLQHPMPMREKMEWTKVRLSPNRHAVHATSPCVSDPHDRDSFFNAQRRNRRPTWSISVISVPATINSGCGAAGGFPNRYGKFHAELGLISKGLRNLHSRTGHVFDVVVAPNEDQAN